MKKCFACDRDLGRNPFGAITGDGQFVRVGSGCHALIQRNKRVGWQPPLGGPKLYPIKLVRYDYGVPVWERDAAHVEKETP